MNYIETEFLGDRLCYTHTVDLYTYTQSTQRLQISDSSASVCSLPAHLLAVSVSCLLDKWFLFWLKHVVVSGCMIHTVKSALFEKFLPWGHWAPISCMCNCFCISPCCQPQSSPHSPFLSGLYWKSKQCMFRGVKWNAATLLIPSLVTDANKCVREWD